MPDELLLRKMKVKAGMRGLVLDPPHPALAEGFDTAPDGEAYDFVWLFARDTGDVNVRGVVALEAVAEDGLLWIAYPKTTSGVPTDLTRDHGWDALRREQWRPVAQVSVDATWSALRWRPVRDVIPHR